MTQIKPGCKPRARKLSGSIERLEIHYQTVQLYLNSQWPKCSLIDVRLRSKPDAGNVTLGCH